MTDRIAYQILESNYEEKEIIIAGIKHNGYLFAQKLADTLSKLSKTKITLTAIELNKTTPLENEIKHDFKNLKLDQKSLILVDDVANTGKTLFYALKPVMEFNPKKVQIAVLIDRVHKMYPTSADYVGLSLSTTLQEHITVDLINENKEAAFLS